jgi:hypothetical protein
MATLMRTSQSGGGDSERLVGFNEQFLLGGQQQRQKQLNFASMGANSMGGELSLTGMNATAINDQNNQQNILPQLWSLQNQAALAVVASSVQPDPLPSFNFGQNSSMVQEQQEGMAYFQMPPMQNFVPSIMQQTNQMLALQSTSSDTGFGMQQSMMLSRAATEVLPPHAAFAQIGGGFRPSFAPPSSSPSPSRSIHHQQYALLQESLRTESDALIQQRAGVAGTGLDAAETKIVSSKSTVDEKGASKYSGRHPVPLFLGYDDHSLSEYQCLVRKQIELFEARPTEVESNAKGRNKPIVLGQVGIRCRHCCILPPKQRSKGAMYYPAKLNGLYQAAQSMASLHLCEHCKHVPPELRQELTILRERRSSAGGGKKYWGDGIAVLGVYEDESGLRFRDSKKQQGSLC